MIPKREKEGVAAVVAPVVEAGSPDRETSPLTNRQVRQAARVSLIKTAVAAGVAELTVRLFEENRLSVKNLDKRAALDGVYAEYRAKVCQCCARGGGRA